MLAESEIDGNVEEIVSNLENDVDGD